MTHYVQEIFKLDEETNQYISCGWGVFSSDGALICAFSLKIDADNECQSLNDPKPVG